MSIDTGKKWDSRDQVNDGDIRDRLHRESEILLQERGAFDEVRENLPLGEIREEDLMTAIQKITRSVSEAFANDDRFRDTEVM